MRKLIRGIVDFRNKRQPEWQHIFAKLALGQSPDSLFIACSDSRVVPNLFASTEPGDLFVIRNVGNMIPECGTRGVSVSDESEGAAVEFAVLNLKVNHIIVCGHSECGAMQAICGGREKVDPPHLRAWLRHGEDALEVVKAGKTLDSSIQVHNQVSQLNVLQQIRHLQTYPCVKERIQTGELKLWGMWFDIEHADVYFYEESAGRFQIIDEKLGESILAKI